jgi:multiple sugar transport system permease protein
MSAAPSIKPRRRKRINVGRILMLGLYLIFLLGPLYWVLVTSIKPSNDYLAVPPVWFPDEPTMVHFTAALFAYRGLDGLINSLIVSISSRRRCCPASSER